VGAVQGTPPQVSTTVPVAKLACLCLSQREVRLLTGVERLAAGAAGAPCVT
jgi:hypothetical protein